MKKIVQNKWDIITLFVIIVFFVTAVIYIRQVGTHPVGESDDYMLSAISLENRFSLRFIEEDVIQAERDYPQHADYIRESWEIGMPRYFSIEEGEIYPWYFGTYSLFCIPVKKALALVGLNQSYAFAITNVLFYTLSLIVVYVFLQVDRKRVLSVVLLLIGTPTVLYLTWPSAEIFIFSMIVISLVFLLRKNYKIAAFVIALAGSMNVVVLFIGIAIVIDYFWGLFVQAGEVGLKKRFIFTLEHWMDILALAASFFPFYLMAIFNLVTFRMLVPTSLGSSLSMVSGTWSRMMAYLFDLNLGFLPYLGISLMLFLFFTAKGLVKRDRVSIMFFISFIGIVFGYSMMHHINSGMEGMARYNAWACPVMLIYVGAHLPDLIQWGHLKRAFSVLLAFSVAVGLITTRICNQNFLQFSPIAKVVLEYVPGAYNPYPNIFISRTLHVDGGYANQNLPTIYAMQSGQVRKIIVPQNTADYLPLMITGGEASLQKIYIALEKTTSSSSAYNYINVYDDDVFVIYNYYEMLAVVSQ